MNLLDTSKELIISPHNTGITLLRHDNNISTDAYNSINEIFKLPINIYFLNIESVIQNMNDSTIASCRYPSIKETIGKTCHIAARKDVADKLIMDEVIQTRNIHIFEESFIRLDETIFSAISFEFPWYNKCSKLIGLFGCSIVLKDNLSHLVNSLNMIMKLGILSVPRDFTNVSTILPGMWLYNIYFTKRESQCLQLLITGKTAKMIGNFLSISPRTAEQYIHSLKAKLNVHSKSELIEKVIDHFIKF